MILAMPSDPSYFDPYYGRQAAVKTPELAGIYNSLVRYSELDEPYGSKIVPDLAERWEISPDGKEITFFLHKGVKWHDGQPFTAADVKFSLERMKDATTSPATSADLAIIASVEVIDDYTVKVTLSEISANFLDVLANGYCVIQAKHIADEYNRTDTARLVGTGPFKFKEYTPGVVFSVERNPDYWEDGLPYLDGVESRVIATEEGRIAAMKTGRIDAIRQGDMPQQTTYDQLVGVDGISVERGPVLNIRTMWFGEKAHKAFNDARVRRAVNLVLEREYLMLAYTGSSSWGMHSGLFPVGTLGAFPDEEIKWMGLDKPFQERVAEAKALMQEAGYPNGFEGQGLTVSSVHTGHTRMAEVTADLLKRYLNISLNIDSVEEAVIGEKLLKRDFALIIETSVVSTGDPGELLRNYYTTDAPMNYSAYSNPEVDRLAALQAVEMDPVKRKELVHEIVTIMMDDPPGLPIFQVVQGVGYGDYVKNYHYRNQQMGNYSFAHVWMDK